KTGERLQTWPVADATLRGVAPAGDGSSVILALADGYLWCWDLRDRKERAIAGSNHKKHLVPAVAAQMLPVPPHARRVAYSRHGRSKAIVRWIPGKEIKLADGTIRSDRASAGSTIVWLDTETGHVRREIAIPQADVQRLALSPDDQLIAVGFF